MLKDLSFSPFGFGSDKAHRLFEVVLNDSRVSFKSGIKNAQNFLLKFVASISISILPCKFSVELHNIYTPVKCIGIVVRVGQMVSSPE